MRHHFDCPSIYTWLPGEQPLVFDWDDETGEVTGPSAPEILLMFRVGKIDLHPMPWSGPLSSTKNRADIAAVVGLRHKLPPELADFYPQPVDSWDGIVRDKNGKIIARAEF